MSRSPSAQAAVDVVVVSRRFGRSWALRQVNLRFGAGESVALLGPNGSGKSTLLKLIATVLTPTRGAVRVFGLSPESDGDAIRRRVGLMAHQTYLYRDLTALENLRFAARMYGLDADSRRLGETLDLLGLGGAAATLVRTFSQGMAQRLALGRALLHDPDLLLLDEPYASLDPEGARLVDRILAERRAAGRTTVLVTHQVERALGLCGRAVALRGGRVVFDGATAEFAAAAAGAAGAGA